jgi:hypothetical protein
MQLADLGCDLLGCDLLAVTAVKDAACVQLLMCSAHICWQQMRETDNARVLPPARCL